MRITTQMLNESARKAGLPINSNSLLNYVNGNSDNTLLNALNKSRTTDAGRVLPLVLLRQPVTLSQSLRVWKRR